MISVVVCTYNRAHYLVDTLAHLQQQDISHEEFEVLVIDNNSTDNTKEVCEKFIEKHNDFPFRYVMESAQGLSYARNRGVTESRGDIITFIDDDAFAIPSFVSSISSYMSHQTDILAVGGKIIPKYEDQEPKWMSKHLLPLVAAIDLGEDIKEFPKNKFPIGANMSIRKAAFVEFGDFDINLGRKGNSLEGSEEKDLFFRIMKTGKKIMYLPQAIVQHIIPAKRVSADYIKNQAIGIGKSERRRTKSQNQFISFLFREAIKWAGTLVLSMMYLLMLQTAKASMLIKFRWNVTKGVFSKI